MRIGRYCNPSWQNAIPSSLLLGSAFVFLLIGIRVIYVADVNDFFLSVIMLEFLAIHSFPFMMLLLLYRPQSRIGRAKKFLLFWGLLALYCWPVIGIAGWIELITFFGLCGMTYLGVFFGWKTAESKVEAFARWLLNFVALILSGITVEVAGNATALPVSFFLILGLLELSGIYKSEFMEERKQKWITRLALRQANAQVRDPNNHKHGIGEDLAKP